MLPDFILIKTKIFNDLMVYFKKKIKSDRLMGQIKHKIQFEGDHAKIKTFGGYKDEINYKKFESGFNINSEEIIKDGPQAFIKYIDKMAENMIKWQSTTLFKKIDEITEMTGNVINAEGKPLSPEMILDMLDKIQIEFDENGQPSKGLSFVVHPEFYEKIKDKIQKWNEDPEIKRKHDKIIEKKRKEWLDRENNRKLVD